MDNKIMVTCLACDHKQELKGWSLDELGYCVVCEDKDCESSFDISREEAESMLVPIGTRVKLKDGTTGIIDGNDFENTEESESVNYYFCEDRFTHLEFWSDHYEILLRSDFEIIE